MALIDPTKKTNKLGGHDERQAQERWKDYSSVKCDKVHSYGGVMLGDNGEACCYRACNPGRKLGDLVYAFVECGNEQKVGKIEKMKDSLGCTVPYPQEKTKYIRKALIKGDKRVEFAA